MKFKTKRRLFNMLVETIALVKSPATTIQFAVVKSMKGGEESVDKIIELVQEICGEKFEGIEKAAIPAESRDTVKDSLIALKDSIGDLPTPIQEAIRALVKISGYGYAAPKKAEKAPEEKNELLEMLQGIQTQVVNSDKKFNTVMEETQKSSEEITKSLTELTSRLTQLESATGVEKSKGAEDTKDVNTDKSADSEDLYESVIPLGVMS